MVLQFQGLFWVKIERFAHSLLKIALKSVLFVHLSHNMRKPVYAIANNKGADLPAHPHSLISAFVVCCLDSLILQVSTLTGYENATVII